MSNIPEENRAPENPDFELHEYLMEDDHYETRTVYAGRTDKTCEACGGPIPIGMPHTVHKFYGEGGEYPTYPVHQDCDELFMDMLRKDTDPEPL